MAKKYKRNVSHSSTRKTPAAGTSQAPVVEKSSTPSYSRRTAEFNPDYTYIIHDLKRIGILAGSFFVVLIALSFILN
jgi:hypothetical protein